MGPLSSSIVAHRSTFVKHIARARDADRGGVLAARYARRV